MFGVSLSSITSAASDTLDSVESGAASALHTTEDLGTAAVSHAAQLGRAGADLGRKAVDAVSHLDVQKAGAAATSAIGKAEHRAQGGIQKGVMTAGHAVQKAVDAVNSHITGSGTLAKLARGAVSMTADQTRFDIGAVGGVGQAAVGLVGSAGQLGVLSAEYQASPSARQAINDRVGGAVESGAKSLAGYASSVAQDPGRVGGDLTGVARSGLSWAKGELNTAQQAIKDGHGPESFSMAVGDAATYIVPIGGEARAAAEVGEVTTRALVHTAVEDGSRGLAKAVTPASEHDLAAANAALGRTEAVASDPAGTIRNVNAVSGTMNCVNCTIATDAMLAGRPASALGGGPFSIRVLEQHFGTKWSAPTSVDGIAKTIADAGSGARGIVFGSRGTQVGHVFNVVNQNGAVRFLDGQTGQVAKLSGFDSFRLLRTN